MALQHKTKSSKLPKPVVPTKKPVFLREKVDSALRARPVIWAWFINIVFSLIMASIMMYPAEEMPLAIYQIGEVARKDIKVSRDLDITDQEGTEKKIREAEAKTAVVYDLEDKAENRLTIRVSGFFEGMRKLYPQNGTEPDDSPTDEEITIPRSFVQEKEQQLLKQFAFDISSQDIDPFREHKFSKEIENKILSILLPLLSDRIVFDKQQLQQDINKGIRARKIPGEEIIDITSLGSINSLEEAQGKMSRQMSEAFENDSSLSNAAENLGRKLLTPNLTLNRQETEKAKANAIAAIKPVYFKFKKGEIIARHGDVLTRVQVKKINVLGQKIRSKGDRGLTFAGLWILISLSVAAVVHFASRNIRKFHYHPKDLALMSVVLLLSLAAVRYLYFLAESLLESFNSLPMDVAFYYLIPIAAGAMLVRLILNSEVALVYALISGVLGGLALDGDLGFAIYSVVGGVVAANDVGQCRQRSSILRAGAILGIANVAIILALSLQKNEFLEPGLLLYNSLFGFIGALVGAIIITGLVSVIEDVFGYATDIRLLEFLNQDNELLKELSIRSPGTQQHSLMVANLAEGAAEAVGANPLLARVCGMYHDIGKIEKPSYFAENQWDGKNPLVELRPNMSALIITNHVKEGVNMGLRNRLPVVVVDCIAQHHGTRLIDYFYEKAKNSEESAENGIDEMDFRYPGPKPQSRETAIIMLADTIEAAARTVLDPSRFKGMVQKQITRIFTDGQLDDCELTLKDLHNIARSFNKTLEAIYHQRPDYHEPADKAAPIKKKTNGNSNKQQSGKDKTGKDEDSEESEIDLKRLGM